MTRRKITIDVHGLALLPLGNLAGRDPLSHTHCNDPGISPAYRRVCLAGVGGYQLLTYQGLVTRYLGEQTASRVGEIQAELLQQEAADDISPLSTLELISDAIHSGPVTATGAQGPVGIPIEMNIALALLLGLPGSPDYAETRQQRSERIIGMQMDIDWALSRCLLHGKSVIVDTFEPILKRMQTRPKMTGTV